MTQKPAFGDSDGWSDEDFIFRSRDFASIDSRQSEPPTGPEIENHSQAHGQYDWADPLELIVSPETPFAELDAPDIVALGATADISEFTYGPKDPDSFVAWAISSGTLEEGSADGDVLDVLEDDDITLAGADYDEGLSEPAYTPRPEIPGLSRRLAVDAWLSEVAEISAQDREKARDAANLLTTPRLHALLPWLRSKTWTGELLTAFFQFLFHWDANWQLWECLRWSAQTRSW